MDLLIVLKSSSAPIRDRIAEFLDDCAAYPSDVFPLTEDELRMRLDEGDPFWTRAIKEAINCYPNDHPNRGSAQFTQTDVLR